MLNISGEKEDRFGGGFIDFFGDDEEMEAEEGRARGAKEGYVELMSIGCGLKI